MDERKTKEVKLVEKNIQIDLNAEKKGRRDVEQRVVTKVEEKISALRQDVSKEQRKEDEVVESRTNQVVTELNDVQDTLEAERKHRFLIFKVRV